MLNVRGRTIYSIARGTLEAESCKDITIKMPWNRPKVCQISSRMRYIEAMSTESGPKKHQRILCLDDMKPVLDSLIMLLRHFGFHPIGFDNQTEAIEAFRRAPESFDLLIIDQNMPGRSGLDVIKEIRSIHPQARIALTSGLIDDRLQSEAKELNVLELIAKPLSVSDLQTAIMRILANQG